MANENLIVFPNGRRLSEFALSGSVGTGTTNTITKWTATTTIGNSKIIDDGININFQQGQLRGINYIEGASGTTALRFYYPYDAIDPALQIRGTGDIHIGSNSGFLRDNSGDVELHLAAGKKLKIMVG